MPDTYTVICINDGTSITCDGEVHGSGDEAKAQGWLVYQNPSPEQIAQGVRRGLCPSCEEDAYTSGAYI